MNSKQELIFFTCKHLKCIHQLCLLYIHVPLIKGFPKKSTMTNNNNCSWLIMKAYQLLSHTITQTNFPKAIISNINKRHAARHFYNKASGWIVAGWTKTSKEIALSEKPMLAGRLRRVDDGGLEIVPNDSGIRLVEARMEISMEEFVSVENKEVQKQLLCWESIDDQDPQFSPLMYLQAIYTFPLFQGSVIYEINRNATIKRCHIWHSKRKRSFSSAWLMKI